MAYALILGDYGLLAQVATRLFLERTNLRITLKANISPAEVIASAVGT